MQDALLAKFQKACAAVAANSVLHKCNLQTQRTYMLSELGGSIGNLLAMTPCGSVPRDKPFILETALDNAQLQAVAACFQTSANFIGATGLPDMRILPSAALFAKAYERFRLSAVTHNVPAATLLRVTHDELADPGNAAKQKDVPANHRSWCYYYYDLIRRLGWDTSWRMHLRGYISLPYEIHARANIVARRVAYTTWSLKAQQSLRVEARAQLRDPRRARAAPTPTILALAMACAHEVVPDDDITPPQMYVPSAYGAALGGSVLSHQTYGPGVYLALHRARKGRGGLFEWPFWADRRFTEKRAATEQRLHGRAAFGEREARRNRAIYGDTRCNLCGAPAGDMAHFATTCTRPAVVARREATFGNGAWNTMVYTIAAAIHTAHKRVAVPRDLLEAILGTEMDSPEGYFITTCILRCRPWAASDAQADWPVAQRLGTMFERPIPIQRAASFADAWAAKAHAVLKGVCFDWWKLLTVRMRAKLSAAGHTLP